MGSINGKGKLPWDIIKYNNYNSVICVWCMHDSVLNVLISVHVVDTLSHLHAVIRKRDWSVGNGLSI